MGRKQDAGEDKAEKKRLRVGRERRRIRLWSALDKKERRGMPDGGRIIYWRRNIRVRGKNGLAWERRYEPYKSKEKLLAADIRDRRYTSPRNERSE